MGESTLSGIGNHPHGEHPHFVQTVTSRRYRFIAPIVEARCEISERDVAGELAARGDRFAEKSLRYVKTHPTNLPVQRTGVVGREKEVAAVKELLQRRLIAATTGISNSPTLRTQPSSVARLIFKPMSLSRIRLCRCRGVC